MPKPGTKFLFQFADVVGRKIWQGARVAQMVSKPRAGMPEPPRTVLSHWQIDIKIPFQV